MEMAEPGILLRVRVLEIHSEKYMMIPVIRKAKTRPFLSRKVMMYSISLWALV